MKAQKTEYSTYHDYILLNKDLVSPTHYSDLNFPEYERITLTKYRSGTHLLAMQTGRWGHIIRGERNCIYKKLQTLYHILFECELTKNIIDENAPNNLSPFLNDDPLKAAECIRLVEIKLRLRYRDTLNALIRKLNKKYLARNKQISWEENEIN